MYTSDLDLGRACLATQSLKFGNLWHEIVKISPWVRLKMRSYLRNRFDEEDETWCFILDSDW